METKKVVIPVIVVALLAPSVTSHGLALDHLPKPWVMEVVTNSSTAATVKAHNLVTGQRFTAVERDYRRSSIFRST